jgi:hypothetical protein
MLVFYNNFFPKYPNILFDNIQNKGYTLIQKCGTQSLLELASRQPDRFSEKKIDELSISNVTVFIRDPIKRFISGLATQKKLYNFDIDKILYLLNQNNFVPLIDSHTVPQFWFLLRLGLDKNIEFTFKDISTLTDVDNSILNLNPNLGDKIEFSDKIYKMLDHFFTEDIILYNQFLNTTTKIDIVINAIKQEKNFINDIEQYKKAINYVF